ncbi:MAG: hypothetical protein JXA28_07545 [Bacteroidetes bacterium]|nr:hypothetical protein [Bacteroidota bacterium]
MLRVSYLFSEAGEEKAKYVREKFAPMLEVLPDVRRVDIWHVTAIAIGEVKAQFIVDAWFDSEHAMHTAFSSAEGRKIAREIMSTDGRGMEMITCEVMQ